MYDLIKLARLDMVFVAECSRTLDAALVAAGAKGNQGALAYNAVAHRLAVLAKWHGLHGWPAPTDDAAVETLLSKARKARTAQVRRGVTVRKKTAAVRDCARRATSR